MMISYFVLFYLPTVKLVFKGHSKESDNVAFMSSYSIIQVKIICTIH